MAEICPAICWKFDRDPLFGTKILNEKSVAKMRNGAHFCIIYFSLYDIMADSCQMMTKTDKELQVKFQSETQFLKDNTESFKQALTTCSRRGGAKV